MKGAYDNVGFVLHRPRAWALRVRRFRGPRAARADESNPILPADTTMSDLKHQFEQAVIDSKNLPERPDNATLLKLYGLFKQGSGGDVAGERPGITDLIGRAKWDAWHALQGTSTAEAMRQYVALIADLKEG
jgi:diazepam-binding inhibitor (GABA receptor modulator, acyl-CoA-binding protein)